jgi:hypothetical protein
MSIRQLSASYVSEEDRVMFRFTTSQHEEYRLWLTRAVVGQLIWQLKNVAVQALAQQGHVHEAKAVAEFRQQAIEQTAQYTEFEGAPRLPLGAEPVLVRSAQAQLSPGAAALLLGLPAGRQLTLQLGDDLQGKLRLLMQRMNESARWGLPLEAPAATAQASLPPPGEDAATTSTSTPKVLH